MTNTMDISATLGLPPLPSTSPDTIAALMWAREVLQQHQTTTYAVTDPHGIEELKPVKIGGVEQWLHIRGRNRNNPILLWLHGGPGAPIIGSLEATQRPWEDYFTVVTWDQRQTGKSYYPADDENAPLTVQQFINDTEELIQYLRDYLVKEKVFLLGSSWGSILGMHMVKRCPQWIYAYIGVGQVVWFIEGEKILYQRLLGHAKKNNCEELVSKIEAIAPLLEAPSIEREKSYVENASFVRQELNRLAGEAGMHHMPYADIKKMMSFNRLISPHLSPTDHCNAHLGDDIALFRTPYSLTKDFLDHNLRNEVGNSFEVPIFFFTGRHDWHVPISESDAWFEDIRAPHKERVYFEQSSHYLVNEEPGKFTVELVNRVLPFAQTEKDRSTQAGAQ